MLSRLRTLDEKTLDPPPTRIGSAAKAWAFVNLLKQDDDIRSGRRTKIAGLLDGNQPWSKSTLRGKGQAHRTNLNLREGEGTVEAAKTPYYDLVFEVPRFANILYKFDYIDPQLNYEWSEHISDRYHYVLDNWGGFDPLMQLSQYQMIVYGVGPIFWPKELDWKPMAGKAGRMLVHQRAKADLERVSVVTVLHAFGPEELYLLVKDSKAEKQSTAMGWNGELCKKAVVKSAKEGMVPKGHTGRWEAYQQAFRNGDLFTAYNQSTDVRAASIFVREFTGKISHYIIGGGSVTPAEDLITEEDRKTLEADETADELELGYLYKRRNKYDNFSQVIDPFFFDTGPDGTWHSIKGLGPKIYDFCDVSNRMTSQMIDGAIIGSGVALEASDANALQETQVALFGGVAVFAPGMKVVPTRIAESLNGAIAVKRELQNTLQANTGQYRQRVSGEQEEPTLGQAQLNAQQQAMLSKGAVNRYYRQLDSFHAEILRRLLDPRIKDDAAQEFRDGLLEDGIPEQYLAFEHIKCVKAVRSIGYGSPQMRDIATKEVMNLVPYMDEVSRNNALRMRAASIPGIGQASVDMLFPSIKKKGFPDDHAALATLENNALRNIDGQVRVTPNQNHPTHFTTHFSDAAEHVKAMQAGQAPPHEVLIHLDKAGPHLKQHLDAMGSDPSRKQQIKQYTNAWHHLSKVQDQLHSQVEKENQNQPQGQKPQVDPETMIGLQKVHGELQIKREKMQGDLQLKAEKQGLQSRLSDIKVAADIRRKRNGANGSGRILTQ
jgi:hypothetical protein